MIFHHVYSFNPYEFHSNLENHVVVDSTINLDMLHRKAVNVAQHPTEIIQQVFDDIRFDEEWVTGDLSEPNRWYMILLAAVLQPSPNLSIMSRNILRSVLPLIGWNESSITLLLFGKDLNTLPSTSRNPEHYRDFKSLTQFGGWLDSEDLKFLLSRLEEAQSTFMSPSGELLASIQDYVPFTGQTGPSLLEDAYNNVIRMLEAPLSQKRALFISSD